MQPSMEAVRGIGRVPEVDKPYHVKHLPQVRSLQISRGEETVL